MSPTRSATSVRLASLAGAAVAFVVLTVAGPGSDGMRAAAQPGAIADNTAKLLDYANRERSARGIATLARDSRLDAIAQQWAQQLATSGSFEHNGGAATQIQSYGYTNEGENLSQRDTPIEANFVHNGWMGSDGHRQNLLDAGFQAAGFGMACSTASGRAHYIAVANLAGNGSHSGVPAATPHVAGNDAVSSVVDCNNDAATSSTTVSTGPLPPPTGQQPMGPPLNDGATTTVPGSGAPTSSTTAVLASGSGSTQTPTKAVVSSPLANPVPAKSVAAGAVLAAPNSVPLVNLPVPTTYFPPGFATQSTPRGNAGAMAVTLNNNKSSGGPHPMVTAAAGTTIGIAGLALYGLWRRSHPMGAHARRRPGWG